MGKRCIEIEMVKLKSDGKLCEVVEGGGIRLKQHDGKRQDNRFTNNFDFFSSFFYIF